MSEKRHLFEKRQKKQFAQICGATGKRMFGSPEAAMEFAERTAPAQYWRAYTCPSCGGIHLTSKPWR
jgi:hypothetical protein